MKALRIVLSSLLMVIVCAAYVAYVWWLGHITIFYTNYHDAR